MEGPLLCYTDHMVENTRRGPDAPLRVAHVGRYATESAVGPWKAIAGMLQNLPRHGVEVELWRFERGAQKVTWTTIEGVSVLDLPSRSRLGGFVMGLPKRTREALRARSGQIDLVHFHSVFIAENARAGSLLDVPYVISPRGGYNRSVLRGRNRLAKRIWLALHERRYVSSAQALHAVSVGEVSELENLVPRSQIFYVPNGIDQHVLDRPIQAPEAKALLFLGRLAIQHKGIDLLLAGYSRYLKKSGDKSSALIVAGPDFRGDKRRVEERLDALGLQDRVSLPGGVFGHEKWGLIDRAYAFVLTSRWEGMPFALLEALAAGRPAVVTPETNLGDLVQKYGAGVQIPGDAESIAAGIGTLLTLPQEQYVQMQGRARRLIQEHFTWERVTNELATHYRRIAATVD
jgi:glycosyltransferase involved in cell wall biosynthesis